MESDEESVGVVWSGGSAAGGCSLRGGWCVGGSGSVSELEVGSSSGGTSKWGSVPSFVSAGGFGFGGSGSLSWGVSSSAGGAGAGGWCGGGCAGLSLAVAAVWALSEGCGLGVVSGAAAASEMKVTEKRRSRARGFIFGEGR